MINIVNFFIFYFSYDIAIDVPNIIID